ncbi:XRE family transcriptional regulator [Mesorhizobium sp. M0092]|uniref:XRE family transcriptional regulator n=1 Tax=unclassified Mesorhizobium TaxID=325217 RepID=UPI0033384212
MVTAAKREIPYNPRVMRWARERVSIGVEDAARRLHVPPEKVIAWEHDGRPDAPTVRQARALADMYGRPFLEFFAREIPAIQQPKLAPDFRFHRIPPTSSEAAALVELQTWAEEIRLNAFDLLDLIGEPPTPFPSDLYCSIEEDVDKAAARVRERIAFPIERQTSLRSQKDRDGFPAVLRRKLEEIGILVLKQSGLSRVRTRGICLYSETFPIIVFGNESPGGTAFTLVHEFAHILLRQSALSSYPRFGNGSSLKKVEGWCNRFAAAFLMPADSVTAFMGSFPEGSQSIADAQLASVSARYAVSPHAALIRLVNLGYVQPSFYWRVKRPQFVKQEEEYEGFGRPKYYGSRYRSSKGDLYTGLVLEAWNTGRITNHNAAEFMGIRNLDHLNDIRANWMSND